MPYEPTEWKSGDVVTSAKLNKIEQGIASGGALKVTVTNESDVWKMDKTFAEIVAAFLAGTHVIDDITNLAEYIADFGTMLGYRIDQSTHSVYFVHGSTIEEFVTDNENGYPQIDNS